MGDRADCTIADNAPEKTVAPDADIIGRQHLFVMRHGERLDSHNKQWKETAARPYDTPITPRGRREAMSVARERFTGKVW